MPDIDRSADIKVTAAQGTVTAEIPLVGHAFGTFIITGSRRAHTENLIIRRGWTGLDAEAVWQMPTIFIGSLDQIRSDLQERQQRFGLSYLVAGENGLSVLAEIASGL